MKSPHQVSTEMADLQRRLARRYGGFLDKDLVANMISSALHSKAMEEVDSIIGTYSADELLLAAAALAQLSVDEARASLIQERQ